MNAAERRATLASFVDLDEGPELTVLDRSTLERAAVCPFQARAVADGRCSTVGVLAEAGEEGHRAFGAALHDWIDSNGLLSKTDLVLAVEQAVAASRPDLQPEAIRCIQPGVWAFASLIYGPPQIHPENILAFDGGEDVGRSGQLAIDFEDLNLRYTSELDLLYQTTTREVGDEVDYKTGWKSWTAEDIRDSFQFQSHAVLALEKYPQWEALRVRVFDTRRRDLSYPVYFERKYVHEYKTRIRAAYDAWRESQGDSPPCWPALEKCSLCPAAALCPVADEPMRDVNANPPEFVRRLVAVEARADAMRDLAAKWVDQHGQDIQCGGLFFGRRKPSSRKPNATIYSLKDKE